MNELEWKQLVNEDGILLYEGNTLFDKPYGLGKTFFSNGNVYQEGEFGIKGLLKGKEYYRSGVIRFEGVFEVCRGYGPNYPGEGKCYDQDGKLYYEGKIKCSFGGVGYPSVKVPEGFGSIPQENTPKVKWFMWEDGEKLKRIEQKKQ